MERNGERYPAARNTAEISWGDSDSGKTIPAQVLNISMNGLFLQTNPSPPKDLESVRVRMIQPHESEWMPGKIVRRSGKYRLGVALESAMSYDLFRTFLEGCDLFVKDAPEALDEVDGHFWR